MEADPYKVLGVPETASSSEIKKAYRKLALRFHPDKLPNGATEQDKAESEARFTAISNAYQILGDDDARQKYRLNQEQHRNPFGRNHSSSSPFQNHRYQQADFDFGFTDPFEVFSRVFGQDFGNRHQFHHQEAMNYNSRSRNDPFSDPFFQNSGFGGGGFGGGFGGGGFGMMDQMMQNMQQNMHQSSMGMNFGRGGGQRQFSSFSSSSSSRGGSGQASESVSTSTQIINGQRTIVTETVKVHPDGRVERSVSTQNGGQPSERIEYTEDNHDELRQNGALSMLRRKSSRKR